jgi:hypothetical protein
MPTKATYKGLSDIIKDNGNDLSREYKYKNYTPENYRRLLQELKDPEGWFSNNYELIDNSLTNNRFGAKRKHFIDVHSPRGAVEATLIAGTMGLAGLPITYIKGWEDEVAGSKIRELSRMAQHLGIAEEHARRGARDRKLTSDIADRLESRIHGRIIPRHIDISEPAGFYPS